MVHSAKPFFIAITMTFGAAGAAAIGHKGAPWGSTRPAVEAALSLQDEHLYAEKKSGDLPGYRCLLALAGASWHARGGYFGEGTTDTLAGQSSWRTYRDGPDKRQHVFFLDDGFRGIEMEIERHSLGAVRSHLSRSRGRPTLRQLMSIDPSARVW